MSTESAPDTELVPVTVKTIERTGEGTVHYAHIQAEGAKTGQAAMVLPGYGMGIASATPLGRAIARPDGATTTRETLIMEHSRTEFNLTLAQLKGLYKDASPSAWRLPLAVLIRAHEAVVVLREQGRAAHLIGHSLGGMTAVGVALLDRSLVSSITLFNSGGLMRPGLSQVPRLLGRFIKNWTYEMFGDPRAPRTPEQKKLMMSTVWQTFFGYIFKGLSVTAPLKALKEEVAVAMTDIKPLLDELESQGIQITLMYDELDRVFPPSKVEEHMNMTLGTLETHKGPRRIVQTYDNLHYGPVVNPRAFGKIAQDAMQSAEKATNDA